MYATHGWYYLDSDCYTRYLRIVDWLNDFGWFEKKFPYANCPYGDVLHFTRINDVIWVALSLPFMAFGNISEALFSGGLIFAPLMCFLAFWPCVKIAYEKIGKQSLPLFYATMYLVGAFLIHTAVFYFGRPDHHCLMLVLVAWSIYFMGGAKSKNIMYSGVFAALGIWASSAVEGAILGTSLLTILFVGLFLRIYQLHDITRFLCGLCVALSLIWVLNPPYQGYFFADKNRLSYLHLIAAYGAWGILKATEYFNFKNIRNQCAFIFCGACVIGALWTVFFGNVLFTPIYDAEIKKLFVANIEEMKHPILQEYELLLLGVVAVAILFWLKADKDKTQKVVMGLFVLYLPLSLMARRFMNYSMFLYALLLIFLIAELFRRSQTNDKLKFCTLLCVLINMFFVFSFQYNTAPKHKYDDMPPLTGCVLTDIFSAPHIAYAQNISTVASPYHNNISGITDTVKIFQSADEKYIRNMLEKRGICYIVLAKKSSYLQNDNADSLYNRLVENRPYKWLKKLKRTDNYLLYQVKL